MTDEQKFNILDDFISRIENVELELESNYESMESIVELVQEVRIIKFYGFQ